MKQRFRFAKTKEIFLLAAAVASILGGTLLNPIRCAADDARYEREFLRPKSEIEKALRSLQSPAGARLPILDGFVIPALQPLERYGRAYYQYSFDVFALNPSRCRVRAVAKITAWYQDPDPAKSSYQLLRSNGRLEQDILDRLAEAVEAAPSGALPKGNPVSIPKPGPLNNDVSGSPAPTALPDAPANTTAAFKFPSTRTSLPTRAESATSGAPPSAEDRHIQQLRAQATGLEEILRNQAHPKDLLVVKHFRTPVSARPSATADVVLLADEGDEFQILGKLGSWVHIQITGIARGWIQRADVELPEAAEASPAAGREAFTREAFTLDREETTVFPGDWAALRGKNVRVVWVRPTAQGTAPSPRERLTFARSVFGKTLPHFAEFSPAADGIAIVFDSADGGMTAATSSTLKNWQSGSLSDDEFWKQCWFDPPEAFNGSPSR